ncbi:MAG: hypothetical protein CM1200mP40_27620 [Gammaproteobacteria bacterium]|nr:MAG: hypothetical protein CM1200mP40_27620 [Gammaproteobacteria bacterium]
MSGIFDELAELGLPVNPDRKTAKGIDGCLDYCFSLLSKRDNLVYEIDGAVIKVDDLITQQALVRIRRVLAGQWPTNFLPRKSPPKY